MAKLLSEYLGVLQKDLYKEGCFDTILDMDSLMFINFNRVKGTKTKELKKAYKHILNLFHKIGVLLLSSTKENDIFWKKAFKLLEMSEFEEICLGYANSSTAGAGSGKDLKMKILTTAKQILDAGVKEPEIFELVGLFEDDIGPDRLSDFIARTISKYLEDFSKRILASLNINPQTKKYIEFSDGLIINPANHKRLYLLPVDILHELPVAREWEDIEMVCRSNERFREEINKIIGQEWQKMTVSQKKIEARKILLNNPELLLSLVEDYRSFNLKEYDFEKDPLGEATWLSAAKFYAKKYPLVIENNATHTINGLKNIARIICNKYKDLIENGGLSELLYSDEKPRKERIAQKLFFGIADIYCESNNLDINAEANSGRGAVDFKFSSGYKLRVIVEIKLTSNKQLVHGFEKQIKEYKKAEKNAFAIYLVIDNGGGSEASIDRLIGIYTDQMKQGENHCELVFIDGKIKPTASKLI
jgi:hypothetical protein